MAPESEKKTWQTEVAMVTPGQRVRWESPRSREELKAKSHSVEKHKGSGDQAERSPSREDAGPINVKKIVPPYSFSNELDYFFRTGVPLAVSAFFKSGIPPLMAMYFAGQTERSVTLQSALGYGRVYYNCTMLMVLLGWCAYIPAMLGGAIGANRKDRIPSYVRRSIVLMNVVMIPSYILQFFSDKVLIACGIEEEIASEVVIYTRLLCILVFLNIVEYHMSFVYINIGYASVQTFNSMITGPGVDVLFSYLLIYRWDMGVEGAALTNIIVTCSRLLIWSITTPYYGLTRAIFIPETWEPIFQWEEVKLFLALGWPQITNNLLGWFIYELQMVGIANISGISVEAIAASALWVTFESTFAQIQTGWVRATSIRTLQLLGKGDPGAGKSYWWLCLYSNVLVLLFNILLLSCQDPLSSIVSNDSTVRKWFRETVWLLAVHGQCRIAAAVGSVLYIPVGLGWLKVLLTFFTVYCVGLPISGAVALSDYLTTDMLAKLIFALGLTTIANGVRAPLCYIYNGLFLNWAKVTETIQNRANRSQTDYARNDQEDQSLTRPYPFDLLPANFLIRFSPRRAKQEAKMPRVQYV